MKLNWGIRVAILYIGFAGLIIYFVTRSMNEQIDLVAPDYYAQELKYQDKIESSNNNNNLDQPLSIEYSESGISINYPKVLNGKKLTGTILLFRPSDKTQDKTYKITPSSEFTQLIPASDLVKGMYRVKVEYEAEGKKYFSEKQVVVR